MSDDAAPNVIASVPVAGPFHCLECGAAKPDSTTWPQTCPACGNTIWTTTVVIDL